MGVVPVMQVAVRGFPGGRATQGPELCQNPQPGKDPLALGFKADLLITKNVFGCCKNAQFEYYFHCTFSVFQSKNFFIGGVIFTHACHGNNNTPNTQ